MPAPHLIPAEELIHYFVGQLSGTLGRTVLTKLCYLADLESRRYLGRPISDFAYEVNIHGPFDDNFYAIRDRLIHEGKIEEEEIPHEEGSSHRYHLRRSQEFPEFSPGQLAILDYVAKTYGRLHREDLLDLVYQTKPWLEVQRLKLSREVSVPMDLVNDEAKRELGGLDLEDVLRGEEEIRQGRTVPWEIVREQIQNRVRGGSSRLN